VQVAQDVGRRRGWPLATHDSTGFAEAGRELRFDGRLLERGVA
jgi:hypothetical protein